MNTYLLCKMGHNNFSTAPLLYCSCRNCMF